jgi:hypothetical protein
LYELSLAKEFIQNKDSYIKYRSYLTKEEILEDIRPIFAAIDEWYKTNSEPPTVEDITNLVFSKIPKESSRDLLKQALLRLDSINGVETVPKLLESFKTQKILLDLSSLAYDAQRGYKPVSDVLALVGKLEQPVTREVEYVTDDINDILNDIVRTPGLRWRLESLNRSLGSLRKGDFGFVFARPETGKTTLFASEVTYMASQKNVSPGPILWFNNEEQGKKVKLRCYQAALGATTAQIMAHPERAREKYREITQDKIKIFDSASTHRGEVEAICSKENPSLILFDQIDKVKGFSSDREDLLMGAIYGWSREIAKTYCPVIGVCQADGTAEGERWLYMGHVSNAKTAKQAEADFILGIGKSNEQGYEYVRYFNISKNKLTGDADTNPSHRHAKIEVLIRPEIARYEDI